MNWDEYYISLLPEIAKKSKDISRKVAAIIVDSEDNSVISLGFNGFPRGVNDKISERINDETRYLFTIHAEVNAILFAESRRSLKKATLYCSLLPCNSCAAIIAQSGIKRVVVPYYDSGSDINKKWNFGYSETIFKEVGIELKVMEQ